MAQSMNPPVRRFRPSAEARQAIRPMARRGARVINALPFQRLVMELVQEISGGTMRAESAAVALLQEAASAFVCGLQESAAIGAAFAQRPGISAGDMALAGRIRGL